MARKVITKTFEDLDLSEREYRLLPFGFDEWVEVTAELTVIAGPAASLYELLKGGTPSVDIGDLVQRVAREALVRARSGVLDRLCTHLAYQVKPDGKQGHWEKLNSRKARDIWADSLSGRIEGIAAIAWVLEVAFEGFWIAGTGFEPRLLKLLGLYEEPAAKEEESTPQSDEQD